MTRKLLEIIDQSADYGFNIDQEVKEKMTEIAKQNVFFDYERLERDEPEIEFDEHAKQPEGLELNTKVGPRSEGYGEDVEVIYVGQGKTINGEWTPHGVGFEVKSRESFGEVYDWNFGTFE